ncbi:inositol monophosphatase family protein [Nocardioides zeae]|uniref:inositol-phosphate phosphatase n=1 Tax=Nocardioides imazamoxiresistens TaxID=3231893 RepID=A0ABU3PZB8_9ACTN|nr:inositol monophosphatase family protein [Nocardioides zeae]MDT9594602.1 inositol monophosphatase family protein [Nocardioides zeae]
MSRRTRTRSSDRSSRSGSSSRSGRSRSGSGSGSGAETPGAVEVPRTPAAKAPDGTGHDELRDLAVGIAQQAAGLVRRLRVDGVSVAATKTSDIDIVTEADRASEAHVRDLLARLRPDDAVVGEEDDERPGTSGVRWVLDPVDGTVNFFYGIPEYAVSLAVQVAEGPVGSGGPASAVEPAEYRTVAGAVVNIATGSVHEAYLDGGARRDGVPLQVRETVPLAQRLVRTGFSYDAAQRERQAQALVALLPRVRDVRRMGSCALDLCAVAAGEADAYVEEGTHLWDHAAGLLVASEAGARAELLPGAGGRDLVLCGPADGFDELLAAVRDAGYLATDAAASPTGE